MKMKKYLMTGIAALALCVGFTSCSHDLETLSQEEIDQLQAKKIVENYNKAFKAYIGGEVAPTQTWGFGTLAGTRTRSGNTTAEGYVSYPATHYYYEIPGDETSKVIASANMNSNQWGSTDLQSNPYGGWIVPDPLTEGQKLRVQLFFQNNTDLSYQDPQYAHFYVQQVYTGGTNPPETGNKEATAGANGETHQGMTLNQLTVGEAGSHINNFNAGTRSSSNVLYHDGTTGSDQITLMLNVDDTSCFGYHETSGSNTSTNNQHNDKMVLVSAADIDDWAKSAAALALGVPLGDPVTDDWNRSFMGFDYELLPESDIVLDSYAMLSQVPKINEMQYASDGTNLIPIRKNPSTATAGEQTDLTSTFNACYNGSIIIDENGVITFTTGESEGGLQAGYFGNDNVAKWAESSKLVIEFDEATPVATKITLNGTNYDITANTTKYELDITNISATGATILVPANNTIKVKRVYLESSEQDDDNVLYYATDYLLGEDNKIKFYSENTNMYGGTIFEFDNSDDDHKMTTSEGYLDLTKFQTLKTNGYHPINTTLTKWVKWQAACDGYYSDWIVTLTEATRIGDEPGPGPGPDPDPTTFSVRVMAEDLSATEASDFDFNDVVIDVYYTTGQSTATIFLQAAGGTLPLRINADDELEVHDLFDVERNIMVNTNWGGSNGDEKNPVEFTIPFTLTDLDGDNAITDNDFLLKVKTIKLEVYKTLSSGNTTWCEMGADEGAPAAKFAVPIYKANGEEVRWADERVSLKSLYGKFSTWATSAPDIMWWDTDKAKTIEDEEEAQQNQGN